MTYRGEDNQFFQVLPFALLGRDCVCLCFETLTVPCVQREEERAPSGIDYGIRYNTQRGGGDYLDEPPIPPK
jgi:hypothetical protein